jgi:hypothetical protein
MTHEEALHILRDRKVELIVGNIDLERWVEGTGRHLEQIYGVTSTEMQEFNAIKYAYRFSTDSLITLGRDAREKARQTSVNDFLKFLEELIQKTEEQIKKETEPKKQNMEEIRDKALQAPPVEQSKKHNWWKDTPVITIILSIIVGAFFLGLYFGNNKFDKDKNDLVDENRQLKADLKKMEDSKDSLYREFDFQRIELQTCTRALKDCYRALDSPKK